MSGLTQVARAVVATWVLSISLTSCASTQTPQAGPPAATQSSQQPARTLPPRPRDLPLDGIDACSLITPTLRHQLDNLNDDLAPGNSLGPSSGSGCSVTNTPGSPTYVLTLQLFKIRGAQTYISSPDAAITNVQGFGSLDEPSPADPTKNRTCLVIVDVTQGQSLWVNFGVLGTAPPPGGYAAMCQKAHVAADSVVQQLLARSS